MQNETNNISQNKSNYIGITLSVLGIILVASNLRSPLTAVGPVLDEIAFQLHLTKTEAGFLTAIPLFVFAAFSVLIGKFSIKYQIEKLIFISLILLIIGLYLRINDSVFSLFFGSALVGIGICIGNVVMPAFIKKEFPKKVGMMTGLYSVGMNLTAAFAAGFSIKIGQWTTIGWKGSLGIWIIPAFITLFFWIFQLLKKVNIVSKYTLLNTSEVNIYKSKIAWSISFFMGLQSLIYYCIIAWLPIILINYGMKKEDAGWILSYLQFAMLPITFIGPIIASRMKNQKILIYFISLCFILAFLLLNFYNIKFVVLAAILLGIANGLAFSLVMLLFSMRTKSPISAVKLSGMSQSIGYLLAGFGPPIFGKLFELTNQWAYSFYFLLLISIILCISGVYAVQNKTIEEL